MHQYNTDYRQAFYRSVEIPTSKVVGIMIAKLGVVVRSHLKTTKRRDHLLKISTQRNLTNDKSPRSLELVRNLRTAKETPARRLRIGLAENVFVNQKRRTPPPSGMNEAWLEVSRVGLAVSVAALVGAALGYLIGRRDK